MYCLVMHPDIGLCVMSGNRYMSLAEATESVPDIVDKLIKDGNIVEDVVFCGGDCYTGEPLFKFYINTSTTYPDKVEQSIVKEEASKNYCEVESRSFGSYMLATYSMDLFLRFKEKARAIYPEWEFVQVENPTPATAILDEPAIAKSSIMDLSILVPDGCKGESWASTDVSVNLSDVDGDGYCIESNWEDRGCYWIIDCLPRGVRLIHSDSLSYNHEFIIDQCMK